MLFMKIGVYLEMKVWIELINPEFTTIEVYKAFSDLEGMMDLTEVLFLMQLWKLMELMNLDYKGHHIFFSSRI